MKKQKKKSLQIVKRIVTLFLILAITSTQIEPSVFAASSDGQWASESLKEDAVTENESADATADSTGTSNTDESHTDESETEKKPETTDGTAQDPGNAGTTDGSTQDPGNTGTTDRSTQDPDNTDNTDKTEQDPDNTDNTDKTAQDPETVVTEEQLTEEPDENLSAADAVLPVEISYYLPKFQELKIEAPEEYTDEEQQEEARAAVTDQAMADETTQKLLEQAENDAESADADESAVDTQALTESVVSEEEYVSYTQMAVTGDTLAAPEVSLPDDVQLDPEADPEDTDPLIGWQVAKLAGIVLSYADGTKINEGDVIPADQINEVSATAADDGIALLAVTPNMSTAQLIALTQDMTVVQRVGAAGANEKWSILVQGGTNQTDTAGTVRHAYGTLANALDAISKDTSSASFKITLLDDYTADSTDKAALGAISRTGGKLGARTVNKPTIVFTGAVNYEKNTPYQSRNTLTFADKGFVYFSGFNPYFTHINIDGQIGIVGNQNNTSFVDVKFPSGIGSIVGGNAFANSQSIDYSLTLDQIITTKNAPIKTIMGGSLKNAKGNVTLNISNSEIYGTVYGSGSYTADNSIIQTGNVTVTLENVSLYPHTIVDSNDPQKNMLADDTLINNGGSFLAAGGVVTGNVTVTCKGDYYAQFGTWYGANANSIKGNCKLSFDGVNNVVQYVGTLANKAVVGTSYISVDNSTVTNVFGWDNMLMRNCKVSPETNFGRMQYDSSFRNYWPNRNKIEAADGAKLYTRDKSAYEGFTSLYSTTVYSTGAHYVGGWNRQRYGTLFMGDAGNVLNLSAVNADGSNLLYVSKLSGSNYKATLMCVGRNTAVNAPIYIKCSSSMYASDALNYLTPKNLAGDASYKASGSGIYVKAYYTGSDTTDNRIRLMNSSGTVIMSSNSIATLIDKLSTITAAGSYTIQLESPYTLKNEDLTKFNTYNANLSNKDVTIVGSGSFIAGGELKQSTGDYADKGHDTAATSFRFSRLYPNFKSLKWNNLIFRGDFLDNNGTYTTEYMFHGNGHDLSFENCQFIGPVSIDAGGASGYHTGSTGSTVVLKNCRNVKKVYANYAGPALGNTTVLTLKSCTGYGENGNNVTIDPACSGKVKHLTINITDTITDIDPTNLNTGYVTGKYELNVNDSKITFTTPTVSSPNTATVNLNGNVILTSNCWGRATSSASAVTLNVKGTVKTLEDAVAYIGNFDTINISGELRLGNHAKNKVSGFSSDIVKTAIKLSNKGKLIFENLSENASYRQIKSIETDSTDTEVSFTYDYDGSNENPTGRPLIVQNALTVPTSKTLRVSTTLMPKHKGVVSYPLLQFANANNAKLEQYTWIADQRYYLMRNGRYNNLIVLRYDGEAPRVYQSKTEQLTLNSDGSLNGEIQIYLKDIDRDAIDKTGTSIFEASNGAYPNGLQVYLSTQDVALKDGVYGYTFNKSTDTQLVGSAVSKSDWISTNGGYFNDINGTKITSTDESPVLNLVISKRTYQVGKKYFIYARDIAGNWSKFLLDTKAPGMDYTNVTSTSNKDGSFNYTFTGLTFTDTAQTAINGTSDSKTDTYKANAAQYINSKKKIYQVRYNTSGGDPWKGSEYTSATVDSSTGVCTLSNVKIPSGKTLYVFAMDGYGNKSKFEFVSVTFDATSGNATPDGKFRTGEKKTSTLILAGSYLKGAQLPTDPTIGSGKLTFKHWYYSTNSEKSYVNLQKVSTSEGITFYPLWEYPTVTISNQVAGKAADKTKAFTYTVIPFKQAGEYYANTQFSYRGGTVAGISDVTAPGSGTKTSSSTGALTFTLTHGQSVTINMPGYYDYVQVKQTEISPYWTTYTNEAKEKYIGVDTKKIGMGAMNRTFAFVNNNDKSQPVVYQSQMSNGVWTAGTGDGYGRKLTIYIRDLYGDGIDKTGTSYATGEKYKTSKFAQVYLSTKDASQGSNGFNYQYDSAQDILLEDISTYDTRIQGIYKDINNKSIPISSEKPVKCFQLKDNYNFEAGKRYFIYVRDLTGKWSKFLLDTDGPKVADEGTVSVTKSGNTYTCTINSMKFEDEVVDVQTSALDNVEKFTYSANATKESITKIREIRYNKTGVDPFNATADYTSPGKNTDGSYNVSATLNSNETLYIFAQDAYNNVTAIQYVPVTFDATEGGAHKKTAFVDKTPIKSTLVRKGGKLIADQIPQDPHFTVTTTQKFLNWYVSTDTTNKEKVDLANYVANAGVTFYANYEMPGITITQSVTGDAANRNQEFEYLVRLLDADGQQLKYGTKIPYVAYAVDGSGAETPDIGELIVTGPYGEFVFTLKHGQAVKLLPGALKYKVGYINQKDSAGYDCTYKVDDQDAAEGTWAYDVSIDEIEGQIDFINTKNIVVTGISDGLNSKTLPIVGLAAAVVMLGASALMLKRRRRS